jgi:hypothetical protein
MQLKRTIVGCLGVATIILTFCSGYMTGKNRNVKRELTVSIPVNVLLYRTIKQGNADKAASLISMILGGKLERYDSLRDDWLFRMAGGSGLTNSSRLRESVSLARRIVREEKTNLVTVVPE